MNALLNSLHNQPALIEEGRGQWLEACLSQVAASEEKLQQLASEDTFWFPADDWRSQLRPYVVKDGILRIPVRGTLLNNFPYALGSWATGYEYIWEAAKRGSQDNDVKGIALIIDSFGGLLSGNLDLNDRLFSLRGIKPIRAYAAEYAYSAAYSVASTADTITVARTGGVGSIGVVVVHMEFSEMMKNSGVTTTVIRSKPGKMEANGYEKLSDEARQRIQNSVDAFDGQFSAMVARNRNMTEDEVHATNALTFMPQEAIENGLADEIGSLEDGLSAFAASFSQQGDEPMADITQAQHEEALAKAVASAKDTAKAEGSTEGASAERARMTAILTSEEGLKRPKAAIKIATDEKYASLDAAAVDALLAFMPEEGQAKAEEQKVDPTLLKRAMATEGGAGIHADGDKNDTGDEGDKTPSRAALALALVRT